MVWLIKVELILQNKEGIVVGRWGSVQILKSVKVLISLGRRSLNSNISNIHFFLLSCYLLCAQVLIRRFLFLLSYFTFLEIFLNFACVNWLDNNYDRLVIVVRSVFILSYWLEIFVRSFCNDLCGFLNVMLSNWLWGSLWILWIWV